MKKILFTLLAVSFLGAGCEEPLQQGTKSRAEQALENQGFTSIEMGKGGSSPVFACSDSDSLLNSSSFTALNAKGTRVEGTACCGWFKGCTVRF